MKHLAGLDASFLFLETPEMPMHVGALHLFEMPADYDGDFLEDMRAHMAPRLALSAPLRQTLAMMPLNLTNPTWVDAEPDLEQHIVGISLPEGSGLHELEAQVGLLHPVLLDRSRPLWKFHVFDGLAPSADGQQRFAMYTQLHHAAVDGQAAVALGQAILDLSPEPRQITAPPQREKRAQLGIAGMLRGALAHQFSQVVSAVKSIPGTVNTLSQMAAQTAGERVGETMATTVSRLRGKASEASSAKSVSNIGLAPRTKLNTTVSAERAFAAVSLPLAALNATRRKHKASLNDAVLMICCGALRRQFQKHGPFPRKSLVAGVPVSTRAKGDTTANNQATMTMVSLGTHLADPAKRLAHILAATAAMKSNIGHMKSLMPTDFPSLGVPWLMESMGAIYAKARVADRMPVMANVTISNVPGPTVPLYMAGAKMLTNYPTSIVVHGVALNITVQTYNESLEFGLIACGQAMPEVAELAAHIEAAFAEFQAMPASVAQSDVPAVPVKAAKEPAKKAARKVVVKKVAAKKLAARKVAVKKPAMKAPGKKVAAKKVTAKKVVVKKAAADVTRGTPRNRAGAPTKRAAGR
ncbi:wax ester/triacylglycerol synthase family O-acyltransferase [soil metagenome]